MKSSRTLRLLFTLPTVSSWIAIPTLVVGLGAVGCLDWLTGPAFSMALFYYLCAGVATLILGLRQGMIFALLAVGVWTVIVWLSGPPSANLLSFLWTETVRLSTMALLVFLVSHLQASITELSLHALKDPLTGASNRRHFDDFFERALRVARRYDRPLTVVSFDIDNFKDVNDSRGHMVGDTVLRTLTLEIQKRIRPEDLMARLGGDEFMVLLPDTTFEAAQDILPRLFESVQDQLSLDGNPVTLSIGAVTFVRVPDGAAEALTEVDALLYQAKRAGKARLVHRPCPGPGASPSR